jgi:hypothetical protein
VEEGDQKFELWRWDSGRNCMLEYYDAVNPGITAKISELKEILDILTHTHYLAIFDITEEQMKKLLTRTKKSVN